MADTGILVLAAIAVALILTAAWLLMRDKQDKEERKKAIAKALKGDHDLQDNIQGEMDNTDQHGNGNVQPGKGRGAGRRKKGGALDRLRKRGTGGASVTVKNNNQEQQDDQDIQDDIDHSSAQETTTSTKKMGKKKLMKLERKKEKAAQREYLEQERAAREKREAQAEAEYQKERALEKELEKQQEEERQRKREEKARREEEEYQASKVLFSVEASGNLAEEEAENQTEKLQEFINHVKTQKVIILEDIAVDFKMRVPEVVQRLEELEEMGHITGVFDDRGKFIYVTEEEMDKVAQFVMKRGRVTIGEISTESNRLIKLKPKKKKKKKKKKKVAEDE